MLKKLKKLALGTSILSALSFGSGNVNAGYEVSGYELHLNDNTNNKEFVVDVTNLNSQIENYYNSNRITNLRIERNQAGYEYYVFDYEYLPGKKMALTSEENPENIKNFFEEGVFLDKYRHLILYSDYRNSHPEIDISANNSDGAHGGLFVKEIFTNTYTDADIQESFNLSFKNSNSHQEYQIQLKNFFSNPTNQQKVNILNIYHDFLYTFYDKKVATGHDYEISREDYFQRIKQGKYVGNCTDVSCELLDFGENVLGIEGIAITKGTHYFPIFKLGEKQYFAIPGNKGGKVKLTNDVYEVLNNLDFDGISHIVGNCDELLGEVQTFFQHEYNKQISPKNITSLKDLKKLEDIESGWNPNTQVFVIGNKNKQYLGLKGELTKAYGGSVVDGQFSIAGSIVKQKQYDNSEVFNVSFHNNFSKSFENVFGADTKIKCGNFTQGIFGGDIKEGIKSSFGGSSSTNSQDIPGSKGYQKLQSDFYCFTPINNNLTFLTSIGVRPEVKQVGDYSTKWYKTSEVGLSYQTHGVTIDAYQQKLAQMTKNTSSISYQNGSWGFELHLEKTSFNNQFADDMFGKNIQKILKVKYGNNINFSLSEEGDQKSINFTLNVPISGFSIGK